MSGRNSALASLTANYTDSEDEEHSPAALSQDSSGREESGQSGNRSQDEGGTQDGDILSGLGRDFEGVEDEHDGIEVVPPANTEAAALETVSSDDEPALSTTSASKSVKLPPEPPGKCSAKLQEKFTKMYEGKMKGHLNMNQVIQTKKMFRNPSIYEKLISHLDIDEFGTNYPENMFNPHEWKEASFYDELAKIQKAEMDRREKERRDRTKVEFVSGTVKKTLNVPTSGGGGSQSEGELKRKSKWDQRGVMPPLLMTVGSAQPPPLPASIVNSVNAAAAAAASTTGKPKTVTISAFGSLPKKR